MTESAYRITPKGALHMALGGNMELTERAWEALRATAYRIADCGRDENAIPAIVFEGGGKCISVNKAKKG